VTIHKLVPELVDKLDALKNKGALKGQEKVITGVKAGNAEKGPRFFIQGFGQKEFIKMNSNSYLGMSLRKELIEAEELAAQKYGAGPGAVRFIGGTFQPHVELEKRLAKFHNRESAMIFSSAYASIIGTLVSIIDKETIVISDELNHNSIINAVRLSRPAAKYVYKHSNMVDLEDKIMASQGKGRRVIVITDGIFSMRGDYAPLDKISKIVEKYDTQFSGGITLVVDDSHGVGAFGETGRGTEEYTNAKGIDILVATLGKSLGVNGGYIVGNSSIISFLRETSPFYIYSNPITPSEASAAIKALDILESQEGKKLLQHLLKMTKRMEKGLLDSGYEIIESDHPVVPLMLRDTKKTSEVVQYLFEAGILATGLNFPVVPKGDEEIRFQISADHTEQDIDYVLGVLKKYKEKT
jgi:glycine C-acetyltransferase